MDEPRWAEDRAPEMQGSPAMFQNPDNTRSYKPSISSTVASRMGYHFHRSSLRTMPFPRQPPTDGDEESIDGTGRQAARLEGSRGPNTTGSDEDYHDGLGKHTESSCRIRVMDHVLSNADSRRQINQIQYLEKGGVRWLDNSHSDLEPTQIMTGKDAQVFYTYRPPPRAARRVLRTLLVECTAYSIASISAFVMYRFKPPSSRGGDKGSAEIAFESLESSSMSTTGEINLSIAANSTTASAVSFLLHPSLTTMLLSIATYGAIMGWLYHARSRYKLQDIILCIGLTLGVLAGVLIGLQAQQIVFQVLPGQMIAASLLSFILTD